MKIIAHMRILRAPTLQERRFTGASSLPGPAPIKGPSLFSVGLLGFNSKIMAIKRRVGGYRNPQNFKTAIYFYCGGLDLYPR